MIYFSAGLDITLLREYHSYSCGTYLSRHRPAGRMEIEL